MSRINVPVTFKGLALFTPGGDLVYCIDPNKQGHWHVHLCAAIAQVLDLPEPPLFLTQSYTATVDRWIDPQTKSLAIAAEVKARVWQYRPLLQILFDTPLHHWCITEDATHAAAPELLESYRQQFPKLWVSHNLILNLDHLPAFQAVISPDLPHTLSGYVLRLFVNGKNKHSIQALKSLHQCLEHTLSAPYTLKVIDVQQHPEIAEQDSVTATPTLIKTWPPPVRRIVGTFEQSDRILKLLDLP